MSHSYSPKERFLRACRREPVDRPPVWMMRQAGRYLPEYREIRARKTTLEMMKDPETACEITLQPVRRLGVDAAILYSDILIVPEAMGMKLDFVSGEGPRFESPIGALRDVESLKDTDVSTRCPFVFEALRKIRQELGSDFPLLGFAGAPFTVGSYMVGGKEGRNGEILKAFAKDQPQAFQGLMNRLAGATIEYLKAQQEAVVDAVQIFDTWAGCLNEEDYRRLALPATSKIIKAVRSGGTPVILYIKGGGPLLEAMLEAGPDVISIDSNLSLSEARRRSGGRVALQGNLDPECLRTTPSLIEKTVSEMIHDWGKAPGYIINLGHGILPDTPVENAQAFVDAAKRLGPQAVGADT